jgi:hypothetical protein
MRAAASERGFTIVELMIASLITMVVMGVAFSTFRDALALNEAVVQISDSSQNLRAGTNLLVRDLLQAGRDLPTGGVPVPRGVGIDRIRRPGLPGSDGKPKTDFFFAIDDETPSIGAITTGNDEGPAVAGRKTDLVTILMSDPFLDELELHTADTPGTTFARFAEDGRWRLELGERKAWMEGDVEAGIEKIREGDLFYFWRNSGGAIQTVTAVDEEKDIIYFDEGDWFGFNQRDAPAGSITQIEEDIPVRETPCDPDADPVAEPEDVCHPAMSVRRIYMYTYYVHQDSDGIPRLMRAVNSKEPQALAGVIEDLEMTYDLVDGRNNPTDVPSLPVKVGTERYSVNQIRKVNLHVGVRSDTKSQRSGDYLRNHLSTVVSLRNLAYVDRYDTSAGQ